MRNKRNGGYMGQFVKKESLPKAKPVTDLAAFVGENSARLAFGEDSPFGSTNLSTMSTNTAGTFNGATGGDKSYIWREMSKQISTRALAAMVGIDFGGFQPMKSLTGSAYSLRAIVDVPAAQYQNADRNIDKMEVFEPMAPRNVAKYSGYSGGLTSGTFDANGNITAGTRNWIEQGFGGAAAANTQGVVFVPSVADGKIVGISAVKSWDNTGAPVLVTTADVPGVVPSVGVVDGTGDTELTPAEIQAWEKQFADMGQGTNLEQVIAQRARNWSTSLTQPGNNMGPDADMTEAGTSYTYPNSEKMASLKFVIDQQTITATSRRLAASFDLLTQRYVKDVHNVDMFEFALAQISHQVALEKDREMIRSFKIAATDLKRSGGDIAVIDLTGVTDNRQGAAIVMGAIMTGRQAITTATGFGPANKLLVSPDVAAILESSPATAFTRIQPDSNFDSGLILNGAKQTKIGTIGGIFDVFVDPYATTSFALLGYKGGSPFEAGIIYHPYMFESMEAMEPTTGTPIISVWSADAISANPISAGSYYRLIRFQGLSAVNGITGYIDRTTGQVVQGIPHGWGILS